MDSKTRDVLTNVSSPPLAPIDIDEEEFSDELFHDDLAKAASAIDKMAERARESLRNGTARKFPA